MKKPPHPLTVLVLALAWPVISLVFANGLLTSGAEFGVPNWLHDGLKPFALAAYAVATVWVYATSIRILRGSRA